MTVIVDSERPTYHLREPGPRFQGQVPSLCGSTGWDTSIPKENWGAEGHEWCANCLAASNPEE